MDTKSVASKKILLNGASTILLACERKQYMCSEANHLCTSNCQTVFVFARVEEPSSFSGVETTTIHLNAL